MRKEEIAAAEALSKHFSCEYRCGEDPPDIYLCFHEVEKAVELSTLSQMIGCKDGTWRSRRSDDEAACQLGEELDTELKDLFPVGAYVLLFISSPLKRKRRVKEIVKAIIVDLLNQPFEVKREINIEPFGNTISISWYGVGGFLEKKSKIAAIVNNTRAGANIYAESTRALKHITEQKTVKCAEIIGKQETWLALREDYFFTDLEVLRSAFLLGEIKQSFSKVLLIGIEGSIGVIYEKPAII